MPSHIYMARPEAKLPGHKHMKKIFILLVAGNASRYFNSKSMQVYQSRKNPEYLRNLSKLFCRYTRRAISNYVGSGFIDAVAIKTMTT